MSNLPRKERKQIAAVYAQVMSMEYEHFTKIKERVLEWGEAHIRNHADYIEITKKQFGEMSRGK